MHGEELDMHTDSHDVILDLADHIKNMLEEHGIESSLADQCAISTADHLAKHWGGQNIYIPKRFGKGLIERNRKIYSEFDGRNITELAKRYNLTDNAVYGIIRRFRKAAARKGEAHPAA